MGRKGRRAGAPARPLSELQAGLESLPAYGGARDRRVHGLRDAVQARIEAGDWATLVEVRAWAREHPLFRTEQAPLRGFLRRWEEAILSGAPLPVAATLVRDDARTAVFDPWERLAARGSWAELRPLLRDDRAAWGVAEARVLRGEALAGSSPFSGIPLRRFAWEPEPDLPHYSPSGMSWGSRGFTSTLATVELPAPAEEVACEPEWRALLSTWGEWGTRVVKVAGAELQALASVLREEGDRGEAARASARFGRCTAVEAIGAMMRMHGDPAPYTEGRGMVEARRAVWRLLAALAGTGWPVGGEELAEAIAGWKWGRYDPGVPDAEADHWSLFLTLEDPRPGLAWATFAWVTD